MKKLLLSFTLVLGLCFTVKASVIVPASPVSTYSYNQIGNENLILLSNPVKNGTLKFSLNNSNSSSLQLSIINSLGKEVYRTNSKIKSGIMSFDVSKLSAGIYFLRVNTEGNSHVKKLIIQ